MKTILSLLFTLLPSFLENSLRRSLLKQQIGKNVRIGMFSLIKAKKVVIGSNSRIKPFSFINAEELIIGEYCTIKSLSIISTRIVDFKDYVHIANFCFIRGPFMSSSKISIGNHSRIFPFCWLDTNQTITLGNHVGVGGFTLIFTHGVWSNYFKGGPISFADVTIEDDVWLPWRVFVMPGVTIGKGSIIGANSLVNKSIEANSLAAGSPAKVLKNDFLQELNHEELIQRLDKAISDFYNYLIFKNKIIEFENKTEREYTSKVFNIYMDVDAKRDIKENSLIILTSPQQDILMPNRKRCVWEMSTDTIYLQYKNEILDEFISFIRRYGVRLTIKEIE